MPLIDIPHVPLAPSPVFDGTSRVVLAPDAVVAPVPPLATDSVPVTPGVIFAVPLKLVGDVYRVFV